GDGSSLFHSFGRFDVSDGDTAEFSADMGLPDRIFARVTWGERSDIRGTIRNVVPGADLYLINPAGVRFSDGASVDVQGSFYATTAARIDFSDGASLAAYGEMADALISTAVPSAFGFLPPADGLPPGSGAIVFNTLDQGLSVPEGETFAAIGERVDLEGGRRVVFSSPGSRIALIAAAPNVDIPWNLTSFDPAAVDPGIVLGEVRIRESRIFASLPAGSILVRAGDFELSERSLLAVNHDGSAPSEFPLALDIAAQNEIHIAGRSIVDVGSSGDGKVGDIRFAGNSLSISDRSKVRAVTTSGPGSDVNIQVDELFSISGGSELVSQNTGSNLGGMIEIVAGEVSLTTGGQLRSEATDSGPGGAIVIATDRLSVNDETFSALGTYIASTTTGDLDASGGDIDLSVGDLEVTSGGQIFTSTEGAASAGSVSVRAETIEVSGLVESGGDVRVSSIATRALEGSSGAAGRELHDGSILGLSLDAERIEIRDGALVGTFTLGTGPAGDVLVSSESLRVAGGDQGFASLLSRAIAASGDPVVGDSGRVIVNVDNLELKNGGQITTSTSGTGDAGLIEIRAGDVEILGTAGFNEAGLFSQTLGTQAAGMGAGGEIRVEAEGRFVIRDGARVAVETRNDADAGDITIVAGEGVVMSDGASISARSIGNATGRAGSIEIDAGPSLTMVDSTITTESLSSITPGGGRITIVADELVALTNSSIDTSVALGGGDGGDISIDPDLVVLNSSNILANALDGNGGRIFIRASSFVQSADSVVQASSLGSGSGIDGEVIIESPDSDLTTGISQPPQQYLDASGLMKTACAARSGTLSSLVVSQVAGLPATPHGPLPSRLWNDAWLQQGRAAVAEVERKHDSIDETSRLALLEQRTSTLEAIR
ncbi:MAG: filamentous hemagglutinin N-terminal domain-containing protein, partial [Deltaproteobacteria bacterium]|nr:filamentous hemagglutinin N-terminal domain-containing protein [Deltaproteobacteria bacterium]